VIGHRNGDRRADEPLLHHDVAAALSNLDEAVCLEDPTDLASRETAKLRQP
jgi:hypothetical protein